MTNRIIKYKAWDKKLKRMWNWDELQRLPMADFKRKDLIWLEYTGLKDKNGNEIYEWDIVRWTNPSPKEEGTEDYIVQWAEEEATWEIKLVSRGIYDRLGDIECLEVIGNIYENPNLKK